MRISSTALVLLLAVPAAAQTPGGYAGQQSREIKALSAEEQADLLAGRGMGLARAGELNHYPGPAHALQLRDKLALLPGQLDAVQASFRRMEAAAKPLGADLLARERELDAAFRDATVTTARMAADAEAIGALQGRLRAVHLAAHLEMRAVLTPAQVAAYDELRGYAGMQAPPPAHGHRMPPG